ncbi:hypothetical protein YC2023_123511 [Brassica napus]
MWDISANNHQIDHQMGPYEIKMLGKTRQSMCQYILGEISEPEKNNLTRDRDFLIRSYCVNYTFQYGKDRTM